MLKVLAALLSLLPAIALAQEKVSIGIVTSLSGPMAAPGKFQMNGFRLAEEEINAAGGFALGGREKGKKENGLPHYVFSLKGVFALDARRSGYELRKKYEKGPVMIARGRI